MERAVCRKRIANESCRCQSKKGIRAEGRIFWATRKAISRHLISKGEKHMGFRRIVALAFPLLLIAATISAAKTRVAPSLKGAPVKLDPVSAGCLACHENAGGSHAGFCLLAECGGHIVSVSYADLAARNKGLLPMSSLPSELVLYEGEIVTCATCHGFEPHSGMALAMDNRGSFLCRSCHRK